MILGFDGVTQNPLASVVVAVDEVVEYCSDCSVICC